MNSCEEKDSIIARMQVQIDAYEQYAREIKSMNNCNNCGVYNSCKYAAKLGEPVRINCPIWKAPKKKKEPPPSE